MTTPDKGRVVQFRHPAEGRTSFFAVPETTDPVETARLRAWWMEGYQQGCRRMVDPEKPFDILYSGFLAWQAGRALAEGKMDRAFMHANSLREELAELGLLPETVDQGPGAAA